MLGEGDMTVLAKHPMDRGESHDWELCRKIPGSIWTCGLDGLSVLREAGGTASSAQTRSIIMTRHLKTLWVAELRIGARGYVTQNTGEHGFGAAIRHVDRGRCT